MQSAFIIPLCLPVVGAHYLPFVTFYGMRLWYVLGGALIVAGLMLGLYGPRVFELGGWVGAALLGAFAISASRSSPKRSAERTSAVFTTV